MVRCFLVFLLSLSLAACGEKAPEAPAQAVKAAPGGAQGAAKGQAITLSVKGPDGQVKAWPEVEWRSGMTVLELLDAQKAAGLVYEAKGSGETALLTSLGGVSNEGGDGRHWLFWVNGRMADKGLGVYSLAAGDRVEWRFALYAEAKND